MAVAWSSLPPRRAYSVLDSRRRQIPSVTVTVAFLYMVPQAQSVRLWRPLTVRPSEAVVSDGTGDTSTSTASAEINEICQHRRPIHCDWDAVAVVQAGDTSSRRSASLIIDTSCHLPRRRMNTFRNKVLPPVPRHFHFELDIGDDRVIEITAYRTVAITCSGSPPVAGT